MRPGVAMAVVLLLVAPVVASGQPAAHADTPSEAAADHAVPERPMAKLLVIDSQRRSDVTTPSLDVTRAVAIQRDQTEARLDRYALEEQVQNTENGQNRRRILTAAIDRASDRATALRTRRVTLRAAYRNRTIDATTYLRALARLNARASPLRTYIETVIGLTQGTDYRIDLRARGIQGRLFEYEGPVRQRALGVVRGTAEPVGIYVSASHNGTVLSMVDDGRHVREAYRADRQSPNSMRISFDSVVSELRASYPQHFEEGQLGIEYLTGTGIYRLNSNLGNLVLTAYLHGETRAVYNEIRLVRVNETSDRPSVVNAANRTRLVVNRSYRGGPLRIATSHNASSTPIPTTVFVDGTRYETGSDGVVWALTPDKAQFPVKAVGPAGNVTMQVRPLPPDGWESEG